MTRALPTDELTCTALKGNFGHLEAAAAAASLASLIVVTLDLSIAFANRNRLRRLNVHLAVLVSSGPFAIPVEATRPGSRAESAGRLSSFGFSGTIAHLQMVMFQEGHSRPVGG